MTTFDRAAVPAAATSSADPLPLARRMYGVVRSPRAMYVALGRNPRWADVLAATTLLTFLCVALYVWTDVGRVALLDQWERTAWAFGQPVGDAEYAALVDLSARGGTAYAATVAILGGPALALGVAWPLMLVMNRTSDRAATYRDSLVVTAHAGVILALRQAIASPLNYAGESLASPTTLIRFFPMLDEASPAARFFGAVDLFVVWWVVVVAIGLSVVYQRPARRIAMMLSAGYLVLALLLAAAMAVTGGAA